MPSFDSGDTIDGGEEGLELAKKGHLEKRVMHLVT